MRNNEHVVSRLQRVKGEARACVCGCACVYGWYYSLHKHTNVRQGERSTRRLETFSSARGTVTQRRPQPTCRCPQAHTRTPTDGQAHPERTHRMGMRVRLRRYIS